MLNYTELFLTLAFATTGCVSTSAFASLIVILKGIKSSIIELKIGAITAEIKKIEVKN